jgi:hypothetical protein
MGLALALCSGELSGKVISVFYCFPKKRIEWLRVLLFPFQAYVVVAFFVERFFWSSLPAGGGYRGSLSGFVAGVILGYVACAVVLFGVGSIQILTGHRRNGCQNLCLAGLGVLFIFWSPNLVIA